MSNPLLEMSGLPPFSKIKVEHIEPAIDTWLAENRSKLLKILSNSES